MNVVVLQGKLSRAPEVRPTAHGEVVTYDVTTRDDEGPAATAPVVWFDPPTLAYTLGEGDAVTVVGQVRRRFFRANGATQSRTEVVADTVVPTRRRSQVSTVLGRVLDGLVEAAQ